MVRQARASKAEAFFKENAAEWDGIRRLHVDDASVEEALLEQLPDRPGWEHLDIGTGTGRILKIVSPKAKRAVGIDLSLEMLTVARSTLAGPEFANCRVRHGDMQQLPLDDDSFDVVTFHLVIHYAERPELVLSEATRPLRPGGKVIVVDFAPHDEGASKDRARASVARFYGQRNVQLVRSRRIGPGRHCSLGRQSAHGLFMVRHKAGDRSRFGEFSKR